MGNQKRKRKRKVPAFAPVLLLCTFFSFPVFSCQGVDICFVVELFAGVHLGFFSELQINEMYLSYGGVYRDCTGLIYDVVTESRKRFPRRSSVLKMATACSLSSRYT